VSTNSFSAEYGRAGGAVINASLRGGTNEFHGAAWEFIRNTNLNAVGFFKPSSGRKPVLVQNQFGGAFGGPIVKDRLFFFADYEGFRRVDRVLEFATIVSMEHREGRIGLPVRNPFTGDVYADGVVPQSAIIPFARKVLSDLPVPIRPTAPGQLPSNNWEYLTPTRWQDDKGNLRVDYFISPKFNIMGRYSDRLLNRFEDHVIPGNSGGNANGNVRVLNRQFAGGFNYTVSPSSLLDFRFSAGWTEGGKTAIGSERPGMLEEYGIPGLPDTETIGGGLTQQSLGGFSSFGRQSSNPQFQNPFVFNPKVNYSKIEGRQSLKAGYEYQAIETAIFDFNPQYGADGYSGQFTRPTGAASSNLYNISDFYFGLRSNYQLNNEVVLDYKQRMHFFYLQDDFKVNRKLTLNLGVRYEFATPQWDAKNRISSFDPAGVRLIQATGDGIYGKSLVNPDWNNWGPRVGFAYQLMPKTVIRSGFGISYVHFNRLGGENLLGYNGPHIVNVGISQTASQPLCTGANYLGCFRTVQQGYPRGLTDPSNFSTVNTRTNYTPGDYRTSYVQSWHFTIQQELANRAEPARSNAIPRSAPPDQGLLLHPDFVRRRPLQLPLSPVEDREALRAGNLPAEQLHLVQSDRQCRRPSRSFQRRQLALELSRPQERKRAWQLQPALEQHDHRCLGSSVRQGPPLGLQRAPGGERRGRWLADLRNQYRNSGPAREYHLRSSRGVPGGQLTHLPPELRGRRHLLAGTERLELLQQGGVHRAEHGDAERCLEADRQPGAKHRADAAHLQLRPRTAQRLHSAARVHAARIPVGILQPVQHHESRRAE
jgi:hypothetical protein